MEISIELKVVEERKWWVLKEDVGCRRKTGHNPGN
jgi:hypothetical protein